MYTAVLCASVPQFGVYEYMKKQLLKHEDLEFSDVMRGLKPPGKHRRYIKAYFLDLAAANGHLL
jgi:hypothetical protein